MESRESKAITRKDKFRIAIFVLILALFPYPFGLLLALRISLGWIYVIVYAGWIAFAVFIGWFSLRRTSKRGSKWPISASRMLSWERCPCGTRSLRRF